MARHLKTSSPLFVSFNHRVISMNPPENDWGVNIGDTVDRARTLVPGARFCVWEPHMDFTMTESILRLLYKLTPRIMPVPNLNGKGAWFLTAKAGLKDLEWIAAQLHARVGVSIERRTAMLASIRSDPGTVLAISGRDRVSFLKTTRVNVLGDLDMLQFDEDMIERLELFGFRSVWRVCQLHRRHLMVQFGEAGRRLYDFLNPADRDDTVPNYEWREIEHAEDFDWPISEPEQIAETLGQLVLAAAAEFNDSKPTRLEVRLIMEDGASLSRSRTLTEPTARPEVLSRLAALTSKKIAVPGMSVKTVVLTFGGLVPVIPSQQALFLKKGDRDALIARMDRRFPGKLLRPHIIHETPFFPGDEWKLVPVVQDGK
jgi:hypothetical protein